MIRDSYRRIPIEYIDGTLIGSFLREKNEQNNNNSLSELTLPYLLIQHYF